MCSNGHWTSCSSSGGNRVLCGSDTLWSCADLKTDSSFCGSCNWHCNIAQDASRLRAGVSVAVDASGLPSLAAGLVADAILGVLQRLGIRGEGRTGCVPGSTHVLKVAGTESCESGALGQTCRVRLALTGGRCDHLEGSLLEGVVTPGQPGLDARNRDRALQDAWEILVRDPGFDRALRETLGRAVPL